MRKILFATLVSGSLKILFAISMFGLLASVAFGQGYSKERGRKTPQAIAADAEDRAPIRIQAERWAIGVGSFFDQEGVTFSAEALYLGIQWHGVGLPFIEEGTSTGLMLEGGWSLNGATIALNPSTVVTEDFEDSDVRLQFVENVDYRIWSLNRVPVSVIPIGALQNGTPGRMYVGVDPLIAEGGPVDRTDGFEARFVVGGDLGIVGPGNLAFEIYALQQDVPIAWFILYGF